MITREQELAFMQEAIVEAAKSKAEDNRVHPKVGALLVDASTGSIICRSHRGEGGLGGHAEFNVFRKAKEQQLDLSNAILFVTLEPCTRRGPGKIPCAVRIALSGVKRVYIGTLDPNAHIIGRGEMFLSNELEVERFPGFLASELRKMNSDFFGQHFHDHIPVISPYAGDENGINYRPKLAAQRDGLLQQSMDLISGTKGPISIFSGDMSWLRELQICLALAKLDGRTVRVLCDPSGIDEITFKNTSSIAQSLGLDVCVAATSFGARGTLIQDSNRTAMICIERQPSTHGFLFQAPHDSGVLAAFACLFDQLWNSTVAIKGGNIAFSPINPEKLANVLQTKVPVYQNSSITLCKVPVDKLMRMPLALERFKLSRLNQLNLLRQKYNLPSAAHIHGSPWPIKPPVIELHSDKMTVVDGAHRVYSAFSRGDEEIEVLLVENISTPLPADSFPGWDDIQILNTKLPRNERYSNFIDSHFRPIREAFSSLETMAA